MCGVTGFFVGPEGRLPGDWSDILHRQGAALSHRGPDDSGVWLDRDAGIGLAHRRLSILDLSSAGHQPMISASGRFVITFNGEIYNHLELRRELGARVWRGHSDTETILEGFDAWGVERTLGRTVGMFAFALWDKAERTLTLARDRMGEKPLYYGWNRGAFLFSSELKAMRAFPGFRAEINRNALALLLRYNYIPAPYSIYQGIYKLLPGTLLVVNAESCGGSPWESDAPPLESCRARGVSLQPYWKLLDVVEKGLARPFAGTQDEAADELEGVLTEAVRSQQISDVPLGALLSGGVDSSAIVSLMQRHSTRPVKTFTIGFAEDDFNEAEYARDVARHLGTEHTELYVTPDEALTVIPRLASLYDEPFSDPSQIPTFLILHLARQHVTVALSGDAGDELFGGYNRHFFTRAIWRKLRWLPVQARQAMARGISGVSPAHWDTLSRLVNTFLPDRMQAKQVSDKVHKLAEILPSENMEMIYFTLLSNWDAPCEVVSRSSEARTVLLGDGGLDQPAVAFEHRMMYLDSISYLPGDILVKVDRAAMGVSLETRVPFLDHRVVEFAWSLPLHMKVRNGAGKLILRQVVDKHVPRHLIERPKSGFGVPIDSWLRGPLKDWAEPLIDEGRLKQEGYLSPGPIRKKWAEHQAGKRNWQYQLWAVLMFQSWLESSA